MGTIVLNSVLPAPEGHAHGFARRPRERAGGALRRARRVPGRAVVRRPRPGCRRLRRGARRLLDRDPHLRRPAGALRADRSRARGARRVSRRRGRHAHGQERRVSRHRGRDLAARCRPRPAVHRVRAAGDRHAARGQRSQDHRHRLGPAPEAPQLRLGHRGGRPDRAPAQRGQRRAAGRRHRLPRPAVDHSRRSRSRRRWAAGA